MSEISNGPDEMSEIKLLPCPFCDGEAKVSNLGFNQYLIFCKDCWAETKPTTGFENTITKWNTRKPMQEIVEKIDDEISEYRETSYFDRYTKAVKVGTMFKAIEIVKEVGGMNEV